MQPHRPAGWHPETMEATAGAGASSYKEPPPEIVELIDGESSPWVKLSPTGDWALIAKLPAYPLIAEVR